MIAMKWFLALGKRPKIIMSVLVVPIVLLLVILILEKLFKLTIYVGDKLFNTISHIFSKENRLAYIILTIVMLLAGGYFEYSYGFIVHVVDFWENIVDKYNSVIEYIEILIKF